MKLKITQYTDPMCVWCYAIEPSLRKINYLLKDKVEFENKLGLLIGDVTAAIGDDEFSEKRYEQLRSELKQHFQYTARKAGMPMSIKHMDERKKEDITSLPMSVAYMAMKLTDENFADDYMRCMRQATHSYDIITSRYENLIELASDFPIDMDEFKKYLENGEALSLLKKDVEYCRSQGIQSFPTILMEYGDNKQYLYGYVEYDTFKNVIEKITHGEITLNEDKADLNDYINYYGKVAAKELQVMFNLNDKELKELISDDYEIEECGTSYFVSAKPLLSCNDGACSIM